MILYIIFGYICFEAVIQGLGVLLLTDKPIGTRLAYFVQAIFATTLAIGLWPYLGVCK